MEICPHTHAQEEEREKQDIIHAIVSKGKRKILVGHHTPIEKNENVATTGQGKHKHRG